MLLTGSAQIDAERAFARAARRRRLAALLRRLRGQRADLDVVNEPSPAATPRGVREVPLESICGTVEPSRAAQFDRDFRPAPVARTRWLRVWLAEARGAVLPPISVVPVGDRFAVSDGHHRVSVAKARGAVAIDALIEAA